MLCYISWPLTAICAALAGLLSWSVLSLYRRIARRGKDFVGLGERLSSHLMESFAGVRVVRSTHSQQREIDRFQALNHEQMQVEERYGRASFLLAPLTETVAVAGAMLVVGLAYSLIVRSGGMLSSHLLGFGFILLRLLPLLNQLYGLAGNLIYLSEGARLIQRWLDVPPFPTQSFGREPFKDLTHGIRFEAVSFRYDASAAALDQVSFELPARKTVALVGPSGAGKSTVASLLLRFRRPSEGRILVDDRDYWEFSAETWHGGVAVVEQEAFLFHDTLARNIAYGYPNATAEAIRSAVTLAQLDDLVQSLPEGLETIVGERGTKLSGGQKQRLAIARALVRDPRILILDEATSSLDSMSEQQLQHALEAATLGRTVLVIAHRLSTVRDADWIVVLERGRVAEQGTWDQLSRQPGLFQQLLKSAGGQTL